MCGILGLITKETHNGATERRRFIEQGLLVGTVRGDDGSGVFIVPHHYKVGMVPGWAKSAGPGFSLVTSQEFKRTIDYQSVASARCIVAHNRASTAGGASTKNSHPFIDGPITLVHNGHIGSFFDAPVNRSKLDHTKYIVDSHVIAHNLATHDVPSVVKGLDGAFALVWYDDRDLSLNVIRNEQRPLFFMAVGCEETILFASEPEMLYWLATRNAFKPGRMFQPKPGIHLKWTPGSLKPSHFAKVELYKKSTYQRHNYNGYMGHGGYGHGSGMYDGEEWDFAQHRSHLGTQNESAPTVSEVAKDSGKESTGTQGGNSTTSSPTTSTIPLTGPIPFSGPVSPLPSPRIPRNQAKTLQEMGIVPAKTEMKFRIESIIRPEISKYAVIHGYLPDFRQNAMIYGQPKEAVENAQAGSFWTVTAKGIRLDDPEHPIVVCGLLRRTWTKDTDKSTTTSPFSNKSSDDSDTTGTVSTNLDPNRPGRLLLGPKESLIPLRQWMEMTEGGCFICRTEFGVDEHKLLTWSQHGPHNVYFPICAVCVGESLALSQEVLDESYESYVRDAAAKAIAKD